MELAQGTPAPFVVETHDGLIEPNLARGKRRDTFLGQFDPTDGIFGHQIAFDELPLDGQVGEVDLEFCLAELGLGAQIDVHLFGLSVGIDREVQDLRTFLALGVHLVAGYGRNGKTFHVRPTGDSVAVDEIVDGAFVLLFHTPA